VARRCRDNGLEYEVGFGEDNRVGESICHSAPEIGVGYHSVLASASVECAGSRAEMENVVAPIAVNL
jgi:hypothetical protein